MEHPPLDPAWPKLLSLAVHEFRSPLTVVAGYIRMLLKERGGPLSDQQRRLLEEADKSCARLSGLLTELSELGALEKGIATFNRSRVDLRSVIRESVACLPEYPETDVTVEVETGDGIAPVHGDPVRLRAAFVSVLAGLRREVVGSPRLLVRESSRSDDRTASWTLIGDDEQVRAFESAGPEALVAFDEWRGGCGMALAIARRILNAHGGALWSPANGAKAAAVIMIPLET